jgi:Flp pilus assembly protein TadD
MVGVPEKAARLLSGWMEEEKIPTDAETLNKLGNLWLMARERGEAKTVFQKAAVASKDGKTYERLASIHFEDEEWREAYQAYRQAYRIGGTEEPSRVSLLAGISAFRAEMFEEARSSLETAAKSKKYRQQAERMLQKLSES